MEDFAKNHEEIQLDIIRDLCRIPAPSFGERRRAEYCKAYFESFGAEGAYIDEVNNVIFPLNCEASNEITVFAAHTDTVFSDTEFYPEFHEDEERIYCPGVGDDTASVAALILTAKYFVENKISPKGGILFVCNSCEEGLGNLVGVKQIFKDFEGRIARFISFDSKLSKIADVCVGSCRYNVEVRTEGGHSYGLFGKKNDIAELAKIINDIYAIEVPKIDGSKTTYNVGIINGGTSVNTIAQSASMLCEYRSSNEKCLEIMRKHFERIFDSARSEEVEVSVSVVGERPCMKGVDEGKVERLASICEEIIEGVTNMQAKRISSSTDCNIPLSLGVPAICVGVYNGGGSHTREEWVEKASIPVGLEVGIKIIEAVVKLAGE